MRGTAADFTLIFDGVRYPRARIAFGEVSIVMDSSFREVVAVKSMNQELASPKGSGKPWSTTLAQGWWRDFAAAEILQDQSALLAFVRRRGVLFDNPSDPDEAGHDSTERWHDVQEKLRLLERAWKPLNGAGVSAPADLKDWRTVDKTFRRDPAARRFLEDLRVIPDPGGAPGRLVPAATNLASYLIASALIGLRHRAPMRKCEWCESWYYRHRTDARFCSASCRTRDYEQKQPASVSGVA